MFYMINQASGPNNKYRLDYNLRGQISNDALFVNLKRRVQTHIKNWMIRDREK